MIENTNRPPPYVGVSGIATEAEARAVVAMWSKGAPPHSLMLGVLSSHKVQQGGERNARSAALEDFASIFLHDRRALGLVHYFTKDTTDLGEQLLRAAAPGGIGCHGVQVNVPWPPSDQLKHFMEYGDYERIVLQVGPVALAEEQNDSIRIVNRLDEYVDRGVITDVLVDASGGRGVAVSPGEAGRIIAGIRAAFPELGIGIAGGLCAGTLTTIADLVREMGLSIDAEGRLRNEQDQLDLGLVQAYLDAAARLWGWA